jgi:hypothetical protein
MELTFVSLGKLGTAIAVPNPRFGVATANAIHGGTLLAPFPESDGAEWRPPLVATVT